MAVLLAKSKSGHDKGHMYVIIKEEGEYVYLADGGVRPLEKPKKKNRKHIQIVKKIPEPVEELLRREKLADTELKRALKLYERIQLTFKNRRNMDVKSRCN